MKKTSNILTMLLVPSSLSLILEIIKTDYD